MLVNSHVQIPKSVLKQFAYSNGQVNYLDLNNCRIRSCSPKTLGTEFGYYSEAMEQWLSSEIEGPFSELSAQINHFAADGSHDLVLPVSVEETCKKYVTASMARSEVALKAFYDKSVTAAFADDQENHDLLVYYSTVNKKGISPLIGDHQMLTLVNHTNRQFVVPRNCFYDINHKGYSCIIVPISPYCALELVPHDYSANNVNGTTVRLGIVDKPEIVEAMNIRALQVEYTYNKSFVASANREELDQLRLYIEDNKNMLESCRNELLTDHN